MKFIRSPWPEAILATLVILGGAYLAVTWTVPARGAEAVCGTASYYAHAHHGRTMANGRPFNMHAMTAAMWGPKFGTKYRVTSGGKSVVVTITDRGPAKRLNRIIDLSYAAAKQLGMIRAGTARVCLTKL
jgi:rare lipoprotein A